MKLETEGFEWPFQRALEWSLMRPRSAKELDDYLGRKTWKMADKVRERLLERGYVNDEKFTRWFVETRRQRKGVSRRRLLLELHQKGIRQAMAERVMEELATDGLGRDDKAEIEKVIAKKRAKYNDAELVQYLMRQGFGYSDAVDAVAGRADLA
ncbi:RecX family transcriptional regulator [Candidatus Saccharibacteria bacterium]|nr:RecX family transcriptional regulator [Candidatus Saccharibacteria bacterium]